MMEIKEMASGTIAAMIRKLATELENREVDKILEAKRK